MDEEGCLSGLAVTADVEGVDDVGEPEPDRGLGQPLIIQLAAVAGPAGIQEPAHGRGALPVLYPEVLADGGGVGDRQVTERNERPLLPA